VDLRHCALNRQLDSADPCAGDAVDMVSAMARGDLSPVDLMRATLERADVVQAVINPFTHLFHEDAMSQAHESAQRIEQGRARPLEGIPLAVKELTAVAGQPHTLGSLFLKDVVATVTDPSIAPLIEAGAIPFARTNTPEFGCASVTDNLLFGETLNPWNTAFSTAGSSGGAAAALATFAAPLAQGTDSAGSLRMPAAACGVVGLKPSHGVVPSAPPGYLDINGHNGPMGRTVADVRMMFELMARPDPLQLAGRVPFPATGTDLGGLRIALITGMDGLDLDHDVERDLRAAAESLAGEGALVHEVRFPWDFARLFRATQLAFGAVYAPMARSVIEAGGEVSDLTSAFVESVSRVTANLDFTVQARTEAAELHRGIGAILAEADLILMPTLQMPAPAAGDHFIDHGPTVNGREQDDRWIVAFTVPFNLTSGCPAITLPAGLSRDGIPTAVQLVASPYRDLDLLHWAAQAEGCLTTRSTQ